MCFTSISLRKKMAATLTGIFKMYWIFTRLSLLFIQLQSNICFPCFICLSLLLLFILVINCPYLTFQQPESPKLSIAGEKADEEFTFTRLYVSKVKSEVKSIVQHSAQLEQAQTENTRKMDEMDKNLSDSKLLVQQACVILNCLRIVKRFNDGLNHDSWPYWH